MTHHHAQHARNVGPNLFVHNENIAHVIPCGITHAMTSCAHRAARTDRQASHPMYMWRGRNYLWMCHSCQPNDIYQK